MNGTRTPGKSAVERKSTGNSLGGKKKSTVVGSPKKTRSINNSMQFTSINSLKGEVPPANHKPDPKKENAKLLTQQLTESHAVNTELNTQLSALNLKAALLEEAQTELAATKEQLARSQAQNQGLQTQLDSSLTKLRDAEEKLAVAADAPSAVPDDAPAGTYDNTLFKENRRLRQQVQELKDAQAQREQDHLDHIEWMH